MLRKSFNYIGNIPKTSRLIRGEGSMKVGLFDFQKDAREDLHDRLKRVRVHAAVGNPQVVSFSAPTGAGKTIVMTALFEDIFFGAPEFEAQPDAVILWISDIPELNVLRKGGEDV